MVKWVKHFKHIDYYASSDGRIKRIYKNGKERILKYSVNHGGYLKLDIRTENIRYSYRAHRFIYEAFMKEDLRGLEINHKDLNKKNNNINNLEVISRSGNVLHANMGKKRGSTKDKRTGNYSSQIVIQGVHYHLGEHKTEELAHVAYFSAYIEWYGVQPW